MPKPIIQISRDFDVVSWSLCRPGRREEDVEESTIFRDFEVVSQEAAK